MDSNTNTTNSFRDITMSELLQNNGEDGNRLWVMIHGYIYDLTDFNHPGGKEVLENDNLEEYEDKGDEFDSIHSPEAKKLMKKYRIGKLVKKSPKEKENTTESNTEKQLRNEGTQISNSSSIFNSNLDSINTPFKYVFPILLFIALLIITYKFDLFGQFN